MSVQLAKSSLNMGVPEADKLYILTTIVDQSHCGDTWMNTRLGLLIAALVLGSLLLWRVFLAARTPDTQSSLLFWLVITLLWGLWAWRLIVLYHRSD